jgi:NhaA family Na+:H+ antiporter
MSRHSSPGPLPPAQAMAERVFQTLERFLHIEAVSGITLMAAAAAALVWANSPYADGYELFWHTPITVGVAGYSVSTPLHFWINDALMTVFFLVVGMEIRRELHEGALASPQLAALPVAAALGGVIVPAAVFLAINTDVVARNGWAVPCATDIAFAVGVLALLGKSVPPAVRVFLLAIAIIDDIVAVVIIALFYSSGLEPVGFLTAGVGILLVLGLQKIGIGSAWAYVVPGTIVWLGTLYAGIHPTLAGVALGLLTPVLARRTRATLVDDAARAVASLDRQTERSDAHSLREPLKQLGAAQRDLLPPVVRVQMTLHPWVAYGVMPLFALANAGVRLDGVALAAETPVRVLLGTLAALVLGKPIGIFAVSWVAVRAGWCRLPPSVTWRGVFLVGCLGGIGFTMSIFIATLAFGDGAYLAAAKVGVILASAIAASAGLLAGRSLSVR